jgi:hypothetical protein
MFGRFFSIMRVPCHSAGLYRSSLGLITRDAGWIMPARYFLDHFLDHSALGRQRLYQCMSECGAVSRLRTTPLAFVMFRGLPGEELRSDEMAPRHLSIVVPGGASFNDGNKGDSHEGADGYHITRPAR